MDGEGPDTALRQLRDTCVTVLGNFLSVIRGETVLAPESSSPRVLATVGNSVGAGTVSNIGVTWAA